MIKSVKVDYISRGMSDQAVLVDQDGRMLAASFEQCVDIINNLIAANDANIQKLKLLLIDCQAPVMDAACGYVDGDARAQYRSLYEAILEVTKC